jgi:hypothetical protein
MNKSNASNRAPPPPIMQGALLCTVQQAAGLLGRGASWVYEALGDGRLEGRKSDTRTLITLASVHAYAGSLPVAKIATKKRSDYPKHHVELATAAVVE